MNPSVVAEGFASALDRDDFEAAARFLTPDCLYEIGGHTMQGREPIIASYRENAEWVKANLDAIQYESVIEHTDAESATVLFTDHVQKAGQKFHFSSRQIFHVTADGLIDWIDHEEIEGQREGLQAFLAKVGLRK